MMGVVPSSRVKGNSYSCICTVVRPSIVGITLRVESIGFLILRIGITLNPDTVRFAVLHWVLGRFNRAWGPERPVFGKVRSMSSADTAREFSVRGSLERDAGNA